MKRSRALAFVIAAVMTLPALVVLPGGSATHERVDFRPSVPYTDIKTETILYFQNLTSVAAAINTGRGDVVRNALWTYAPRDDDPTRQETYAASTTTGTNTQGFAKFRMERPFTHNVTVNGTGAFWIEFFTNNDALNYQVTIIDGTSREEVAKQVLAPDGGVVRGDVAIIKPHKTHTFSRNSFVEVQISGRTDIGGVENAGAWTLLYGSKQSPSRLSVTAENAVQVAAWTEDEEKRVMDAFQVDKQPGAKNWIHGYFVVKSAFGIRDFQNYSGTGVQPNVLNPPRAPEPEAELVYYHPERGPIGVSFTYTEGERMVVPLTEGEFSSDAAGLKHYKFDPRHLDHIDYAVEDKKRPAGMYEIRFTSQFRRDDPAQSSSVTARAFFTIASPGIELIPYPATPAESTSHEVQAGKSSTFVLLARNKGDTWDNITLTLSAIPGPQAGWAATIAGPALKSGNRVELPPKGEGIVTVTIQTPSDSTVGAAATYQVRGRSQIAPDLVTDPVPLLVTVADNVGPGAGIIVPDVERDVRAGGTITTPVYLWNRGSAPADLSLNLSYNSADGWTNESLVYAGIVGKKVSVEQIAPGAIVEVGVRASATRSQQPALEHTVDVVVEASFLGENVVRPTASIKFEQDLSAGFVVELLNGFGGAVQHVLEMERSTNPAGNDPRSRAADRDALNGTWYRLWITNIGASEDTYTVRPRPRGFVETIDPGENNVSQGGVNFAYAWGASQGCNDLGCPPLIGFRTQDGRFEGGTSGDLVVEGVPAGYTKELYVWVPHQRNHDEYPLSLYSFDIEVSSSRAGTQTIPGSARANDACTADQNTFQATPTYVCGSYGYQAIPGLEAVERIYDPARNISYDEDFLVDVTYADKRAVTKHIALGQATVYKVRATNAASFGTFTTANGIEKPSTMTVGYTHNSEDGWRVKIRFAGQAKVAPEEWNETNDWGGNWNDTLLVYNHRPTNEKLGAAGQKWKDFMPPPDGTGHTHQNFYDREIEVLVQPPNATTNKRVFAGESHPVQLRASIDHPVATTQTTELTLNTVVGHLPSIELSTPIQPGGDRIFPSPGRDAYLGLLVLNNGSAAANVTLTVTKTEGTGGTGAWTVTPTVQSVTLTARENRTIAYKVTAPPNVPAGTVAEFEIRAEWRERLNDPTAPLKSKLLRFTAEVPQQIEKIGLRGDPAFLNAEPRETISAKVHVKNEGQAKATYRLDTISVRNWTVALQQELRDVQPSEERAAVFLANVPGDVVSGSQYQFVVRVREIRDDGIVNEDYQVLTVQVLGGKPVPSLQVGKADQIIERNGKVHFEIGVRNLGNVEDTFPISVIGPGGLGWRATMVDPLTNESISEIRVPANSRRVVNLTVFAPADVQERTVEVIEFQAMSRDRTSVDKVTLRARIHDYGLDVRAEPARADMIPGLQAVYNVRVHNLGNDNDTFNLSLDMGVLADLWSYEYGQLQVRVPPGEFRDVRLTVRSPKDNLPTPRTVEMKAYAGSVGAANISLERFVKLDSTPITLTVLDYRVGDVDGDGLLEVAVDANKRRSDGFETFREIYTTGVLSQAIESAQDVVTGHTRFLIDVPQSGAYDGIADIFWDPDLALVTRILYVADVNFDASPDYFLDLDADTRVDRVWDSAGRRYLTVDLVDILNRGELRKQILVFTDTDRFPDAFYDPEKNEVWKVIPTPSVGENVVGFIPKDKTKPTLYYDVAAKRVYQSPLIDSMSFLAEHWYAVVTFLAAVVLLGVAIARRKPA